MITINIMVLLKALSLICLGILILLYMGATFATAEKVSFFVTFTTFILMALPFIYILFN